ncbi:hypothetical protein [Nocardia sp. BMG51109]|uniref:protein kinase domain-containing protein n=1 Tax=Nocardia sp. BMG51109 TaxID=1056816 RepID=UPI0004AF09B0|nr:hypothetical protein [Nocardia sp. BMG51109]
MSMQYVDGVDAATVNPHTLPRSARCRSSRASPPHWITRTATASCTATSKPANIMLARSGGGKGERVFLTDFGIARLREDSQHLTQAGMFTATLAYASPEQMTGAVLDHASDQYSLGLRAVLAADRHRPVRLRGSERADRRPPAAAGAAGQRAAGRAVTGHGRGDRAGDGQAFGRPVPDLCGIRGRRAATP